MPIYSRPYNPDGPDFAHMWQLVQQDYARRKDSFIWLVSRFGDWKYGCWREAKYFPMFFRRNAQLWLDGFDEVKGFVCPKMARTSSSSSRARATTTCTATYWTGRSPTGARATARCWPR